MGRLGGAAAHCDGLVARRGWPRGADGAPRGRHVADIVVVGGGYLGMWTAWQLKQLAPGADVVLLEASLCGHGPSGRNGGFCETLWGDLPTLRERALDERAR